MKKHDLTKKEHLMLYGLIKYPNLTDKKLSTKLNLKQSTVTSIRHRLHEKEYFRKLNIPQLQDIGCEMLVIIYTNFNLLIPLEERIEITDKNIEVFEEIFFSVGDQDKGFSLSLSKDYATIGRINDIRTHTFGGRGLLEEKYPNMILFPFNISKIYRFFDYASLINSVFSLNLNNDIKNNVNHFLKDKDLIVNFSDTEKNVYCMMISYPEMSDTDLGKTLGISRHTVSRLRRMFESKNLVKKITVPNLVKLGFKIMVFYHIKFDPSNPPNMESDEAILLINDSTIFFASREFESIMISIHKDYDDYKKDMMKILQILKEKKWIVDSPIIKIYSLNTMIFIKDFKFAPITHKIVDCDFWVKKLLNI